ncbi:uncharacterized protein METZ01_LOCUS202984, partial [marine metagenome]
VLKSTHLPLATIRTYISEKATHT